MQLSIAATVLACTGAAQAFSDSSPFYMFSSSELPTSLNHKQLQTSNSVLAQAQKYLSTCPTQYYILVSQPNVHADDIHDVEFRCTMPNLCRAIGSETTHGRFSVREVIGKVLSQPLADHITVSCAEKGKAVKVEEVALPRLPSTKEAKRAETLADNDHELGQRLETLGDDYTVIFFSDPNEFKAYEPDFAEAVHMNLKRQSKSPVLIHSRLGNSTRTLPLFEKYQFFTPGIFMVFVALVVMLSILTVGLKALVSLEVSYGAFDKDMGPAAQKNK
ncbi:BIG/ATPase V1 complex, subunit S1 [Podospora didyma]|uniref:Protein BIG1 n=1 Tax=Podospora didyma TaxID=330526 RepID=A0AAE0NCP0_9PEZI|nr:BIG/ATPase V1 complex, subunit S1 [Podospora didyma]